jgi:outer membrane protein assembly factor BamB
VAKGAVYFGAGPLYALNAKNGSRLWTSASAVAASIQHGSPTVSGGIVYAETDNGILSAFNASAPNAQCSGAPPARTCTPIWSTGVGWSYTTPTIANGVIYTTESNWLDALDTSGNLLWRTQQGVAGNFSPTVAGGVVYVADVYGHILAYSTTSTASCQGTPRVCPALWTGTGPNVLASPIIADGVIYGATSTDVTAFRLP